MLRWGKRIAPYVPTALNFSCPGATFSRVRVPGAFVTTLLIYAAGLLLSFIVLVVVAFVYVIMSEDDKDDQHKN